LKRTVVVAVLFDVGAENPFLTTLLSHFDVFKDPMNAPQTVAGAQVMYGHLLAAGVQYGYWGSLTTPLCTPGIYWVLNSRTITASQAQIDTLKRALPQEGNWRPVQGLKGRLINGP
jgi:carbonic anhydrase